VPLAVANIVIHDRPRPMAKDSAGEGERWVRLSVTVVRGQLRAVLPGDRETPLALASNLQHGTSRLQRLRPPYFWEEI
jgi:hypothetical protein